MRTNKRRNLNSSQWACIAVEADEIIAAIAAAVESEKLRKQKENAANQHTEKAEPCGNKLPEPKTNPDKNKATQKAAEIFNTNRHHLVPV